MIRLQSPTDPTPSKEEWMQRFIQDLGVLTGGEQNDMFYCRNPNSPTARADFNSAMDVDSLSDSESALITQARVSEMLDSHVKNAQTVDVHARDSLEVPERGRKLSSSRKESIDKSIRKTLKKKVSFDKGQSYNTLEEAKEEEPRQKRSLPRQEIAIDVESPISNKKLSDIYPVLASEGQSGIDGQSSQSQDKTRKMGKYGKLTHENTGLDSSQSTEMSSFSGISQESVDENNENSCPSADSNLSTKTKSYLSEGRMGMALEVPNLVVKATITEKSDSRICGTNNTVLSSKADSCESESDSPGLLELPQVVNKTMAEKLNSGASNGNDGILHSSVTNCNVIVDDNEPSNSLNKTKFSQDSQDSNETDSSHDGSDIMLLPTDDSKNKNGGSPKILAKNDENARWSCSELDSSKETSL